MTLLSIVGEDISHIVPVLNHYRHACKHHLLFSDDAPNNVRRAKMLQRGMKRFSKKHGLGWKIELIVADEDSMSDIASTLVPYFKAHEELWLNVTSGNPMVNILLSTVVKERGGSVISYDHFDNDLQRYTPDGRMEVSQLESRITIEDYVTLLDQRITQGKTKDELAPLKKQVMSLYLDRDKFLQARNELVKVSMHQQEEANLEGCEDVLNTLRKMGIVDKANRLIRSKQTLLQGEIFEMYVFWLCEALKPDDIMLGVKIDFDEPNKEPNQKNRVFNEFDILLINKNRIYTVECKFQKSLNGLGLVYKYDAIIDYFGKASKAMIVNISNKPKEPYMLFGNVSDNFSHSTLRRARMARVQIYHESRIDPLRFSNTLRSFFNFNA